MWKPVIAAVNGTCAGGGLHFVADADIVLASSDATFLDPHVSLGQVTAYEAIGLTRKIPFEAVMRMALVGRHERISAERALALGMVSQVVDPPERLHDEAQALAEKIAENSPAAMAATKRALWGALEAGLTDACKAGAKELVSMWGHPDQEEGPRAFAEKRAPQWQALEPGVVDAHRASTSPTKPRRHRDLSHPRHAAPGAPRSGRLVDQQPARSPERHELAHPRRVRDAWKTLDADPEVRVIVHTGEGRAFQTGVDVMEIAEDGVGFERYRESTERFDYRFTAWQNHIWKPVITAVNGICAGGGFHWVAEADIVIAASDAQFFDPHVSVGQVVAMEAIGLTRKIPFEAVMRMALVGPARAHLGRTRPGAGHGEPGGRSARAPPRRGAGARREDRRELARRHGGHQARPVGRPRGRPHRRLQGRRQGARLHVGPPRPGGGPAGVRREARPALAAARAGPALSARRRVRHIVIGSIG